MSWVDPPQWQEFGVQYLLWEWGRSFHRCVLSLFLTSCTELEFLKVRAIFYIWSKGNRKGFSLSHSVNVCCLWSPTSASSVCVFSLQDSSCWSSHQLGLLPPVTLALIDCQLNCPVQPLCGPSLPFPGWALPEWHQPTGRHNVTLFQRGTTTTPTRVRQPHLSHWLI